MLLLFALLCSAFAGPAPRAPGAALSDAFSAAAARALACTVHIEAEKTRPWSKALTQLFVERGLPLPPPRGDTSRSTGAGVIVRADGLVLTNHHVVGGATALTLRLADRRTFAGALVGSDPRTDIALVRIIGASQLQAAPLGPAAGPRVGSWVMAVGHPYDFDFTVTAGVVSAVGRRNLSADELTDYIQTDAIANPGSSGGPVFDLDGRLVGITTAVYAPKGSAASTGISFSIPAAQAWSVATQLLGAGPVHRAAIGLFVEDAQVAGPGGRPGARVNRVVSGGPAALAGVQRGDVIVAVDGQPIGGARDLRTLVLTRPPGSRLRLELRRGAEIVGAELILGDASAPPSGFMDDPAALRLGGMAVLPYTEARGAALGVEGPHAGGLLVAGVTPGGPAALAGLLPGDLLLQAAESPLQSLADLSTIAAGRRTLPLRIQRDGGVLLAILAL